MAGFVRVASELLTELTVDLIACFRAGNGDVADELNGLNVGQWIVFPWWKVAKES